MALTPLDVQKTRFPHKLRGYDAEEVDSFLALVAEELTALLGRIDQLEHECRYLRQRHREAEEREHQLQETLVRAQKVSDEITANAKREAQLLVQEAEITADRIVNQAIAQANEIESRLSELRIARRDLQLKLKNTLDLFAQILEAERADEGSQATIRTLPRQRTQG